MIVNLINKQRMFSSKLPEKVSGQYWIKDIDEEGRSRELIGIEADAGKWIIKSNQLAWLVNDNDERLETVTLKENNFLNLQIRGCEERVILVTHPVEERRQTFEKYVVRAGSVLEIGRAAQNQIIHDNKYTSSKHAVLTFKDGIFELEDLGSTNGTYVNGICATQMKLSVGDIIYIMGLQIIIGSRFIAMNNPDGALQIKTQALQPFQNQQVTMREAEKGMPQFFYRSPRFRREIEPLVLNIDEPPRMENTNSTPMAMLMGPALTMGMASIGSGAFSVINTLNNNGSILTVMPTVIMSVSMLLGTVMWPVLTKKHEKKEKIKYEKARQEKYFSYLNEVKDKIKRASSEQKAILEENIISCKECMERIRQQDRRLWERMPVQDDFLRLRVGTGELPLQADIKYQEHKFEMSEDNLVDAMLILGKEEKILKDVPISVSLIQDSKLGLVGERRDVLSLTRSLLLQVLTLHSYDEVKLVLIMNENECADWEDFFYTMHIWNADRSMRFLAENVNDMKALSAFMEKEILKEAEEKKQEEEVAIPHYVIVAADKQLADKSEVMQKLIACKDASNYSMLLLYDEIRNLPKETTSVVEIHKNEAKKYDRNDISGKAQRFLPEVLAREELKEFTESLANMQLDMVDENFLLPNSLTFLEMFGVGKIGHLNSLQRWKENNPALTLQTPIGVDAGGDLSYLDLHEKYHGPHGLVAGMTGSGKSEFIITYILSLAVNYHPDEVAFILIDYKGGGLAGAFEDEERGIKLPHLAGTITNLDGAAVKRSLISIQSELRRRQAIFNEARKIANEGTMDIYKYQTLYRNQVVSEKVPHLFIISDEFAELKAQQPEFMEQLISAARIGRSLGVHLILATQKPAGVVDDQIWSNSKFRVCLKVQDKSDSMDMIKRPDAAEISQTGRYYLQVGFNEYFALGQSAWCGADYVPMERLEKKADYSIQIIDHLGQVIKEVKQPKQKVDEDEKRIKQVVGIVKYLSDLAEEEQVTVRPLWLPAIPAKIYVDDLYEKYGIEEQQGYLNPVVGEYDDPFNQKQFVLQIDFSRGGNCLIYGASGNGKITFLTSMIYSMISKQSAEYLNLYLLDFGAETLKVFEKAPQVGGVVLSHEEERIKNLFKLLSKEMESRKRYFAEYGGDIQTYLQKSDVPIPNIVVIINNYTALNENYEDLEERIVYLMREGSKYGIFFCATVSTTNGMRYRAAQNFAQVLTMQQNDPTDYPIIVGKTEGVLPTKCKGRGLIRLDKVYEFQTAYCLGQEQLRSFCLEIAEKEQTQAREIPILPEVVNAEVLKRHAKDLHNLPVGIGKEKLEVGTISLVKEYIYMVISQDSTLAMRTAFAMGQVCSYIPEVEVEVWDVEGTLGEGNVSENNVFTEGFEERVSYYFGEIVTRNNTYKEAGMNATILDDYSRKVVVICGLHKLFEILSADGKDKLRVFWERGQSAYKVHFIVAENSKQISSYTSDSWYARSVSAGNGLWIGDGFTDQYTLKIGKYNSSMYQEIGDSFGYLIEKGKAKLLKVVTLEEGDGNE